MDVQTVTDFIKELGVPIAGLAILFWYFVKPLGGKDGLVAEYLTSQSESLKELVKLSTQQKDATENVSDALLGLQRTHSEHHVTTSTFQAHTTTEIHHLLHAHSKMVRGLALMSDNNEAKELFVEADRIVRQCIEPYTSTFTTTPHITTTESPKSN